MQSGLQSEGGARVLLPIAEGHLRNWAFHKRLEMLGEGLRMSGQEGMEAFAIGTLGDSPPVPLLVGQLETWVFQAQSKSFFKRKDFGNQLQPLSEREA